MNKLLLNKIYNDIYTASIEKIDLEKIVKERLYKQFIVYNTELNEAVSTIMSKNSLKVIKKINKR